MKFHVRFMGYKHWKNLEAATISDAAREFLEIHGAVSSMQTVEVRRESEPTFGIYEVNLMVSPTVAYTGQDRDP